VSLEAVWGKACVDAKLDLGQIETQGMEGSTTLF
jgi:hypothetical protein